MATIIPSGGGGGGGGAASADRTEIVDADGNGDHTTIADALTAIAAYGTAPSASARAAIEILDSAVYSENVALTNYVDLIFPKATIDGTITAATFSRIKGYRIAPTTSINCIAVSAAGGDVWVDVDEVRPYSDFGGETGNGILLSGGAATVRGRIGFLDLNVDEGIRVTGSGRLYLRIDHVETQIGSSALEILEQSGGSSIVELDIGSVVGTSMQSSNGLFQISAGSSCFINVGNIRFDGANTSKIWAISGTANAQINIGSVTGWDTANTNTSSGTVKTRIGNDYTTWDHPAIGLPAAHFPCDETSGNLADGIGALSLTATGTPGYRSSCGGLTRRIPGVHNQTTDYFQSSTTLGLMSGDFTLAFLLHNREAIVTSPILAVYKTADTFANGAFNIHTTSSATQDHIFVSFDGSSGASSPLQTPVNWGWNSTPLLIVLRRSSSTGTLWINGIQMDSATVPTTDYSGNVLGLFRLNTTDLTLTGQNATAAHIGIWDSALSDAAIEAMIPGDGTIRIGAE